MERIVATHCAICRRPLHLHTKDPISVETGIGPDCRKGGGYDKQDAKADWGAALAALGNDCPADLYEVVAEAHGVRKGHGEAVDTTLADAAKALRGIGSGEDRRPGLTWYLATATMREVSREGVVRILLAVHHLGYTKLASALAKGLYVNKEMERHFKVVVAHVAKVERPAKLPASEPWAPPTYTRRDKTTLVTGWVVTMSYSEAANANLRQLGAAFVNDRRARKKFWAVPATATARQVFDALWAARDMDLIAGDKGVKTPRDVSNLQPADRVWWDDPCLEEDRTCWVSSEHGELVRYAIPGEPPARPGIEKVPSEFFGHRMSKAVGS